MAFHHLAHQIGWFRVVFTDESCLVLDRETWDGMSPSEISDEIFPVKQKLPTKAIVFAGTWHDFQSGLVLVESGSMEAIAYADDTVSASGITPEINGRHGVKRWTYMHNVFAHSNCHRVHRHTCPQKAPFRIPMN
jgi:hypothetical protein